MNQYNTKSYLEALKNGDAILIREIYKNFFPNLLSWIQSNSGDQSDALDIFHDALEVIIYQVHQPNSRIWEIDLGPYLFRICRNKWVDQLRRKKTFDEKVSIDLQIRLNEEADTSINIEKEGVKESVLKRALEDSFLKISDICRSIIEMMNRGLSPLEMADQLSMPNTNTFYRRKFACLKRWKEILEADASYQSYKEDNDR